ncbi:ABC transporter ATP-binding protein [Gracilibacillus halophilus YIM-C55.5]|uniref:ABC transporter ATP-binding protein n=1 Tax=Gracilibacillus halophilus YIM-C55.5 TaxID=1308866 RepID=N4WSG9_9BACI|nr:ABC transporter ATP-binding protein [Gracilibacillus halophilus]ENH96096.1 ABC transporter ATP-binding protein [Gracilibacillus halophilus YIM-C55.5]
MNVIHTENVTKRFGSFTALQGVDLEVKQGEVYGFIGPNGAGKSTTLRILLGILQRSSGKATIFGKDVWKEAVAIHQRIAYVPGDIQLWENLTGGEVIDVFLQLHGNMNRKKRDDYIQRFQLDPTKKCGTYSKGNRQKVALVAALASDADLYIFDEPTSGLDPLMERTFQEAVEELKQKGKTVLLSSHILSEVEQLCDRIGIIKDGEIIETGTLEELRHLTRTNLVIKTRDPIADLHDWTGVYEAEENGGEWTFQVDQKQMATVMEALSRYQIIKLESIPPTLEDLFIRHYENQQR